MKGKDNKKWFVHTVGLLLGLAFALVLGGVFYGVMAYQLAGGEPQEADTPAVQGVLLALPDAQLVSEQTQQQEMGGALCTVITRSYLLPGGETARAITARPAAYLERLSAPGVQMQLITGFVIAGLDAVYAVSGETGLLAARDGDMVYMIEGPADQQAMYMLGAAARR